MSSATMQGLVYRGPRERTQIEEVAVPAPEAGQVLMKVGAVGVITIKCRDRASSATNFLA